MSKFVVVRSHQGDRFYTEGEIREGDKGTFAHLIPHVLRPATKADLARMNQAEPPVANKADNRRGTK
jgi:hypothetical protein